MKDILRQIQESAKFTLSIFDGALEIEGRILSPAETEAAGLTSSMIATQIMGKNEKKGFASLQARIKGRDFADLEEELIEELIQAMGTIKPESLLKMEASQDHLLIQIVKRASSDEGKTWERLHLVTGVDQQDADQGRLWVGMITKEDRTAILERALSGHSEAITRLETFRDRS